MHFFFLLFVKIKIAAPTHPYCQDSVYHLESVCTVWWPGGWCRWHSGAAAAAEMGEGGATGTAGVSLGSGEGWEWRHSASLYTRSVHTVPPPHLCSPPPPDRASETARTSNSQIHLWEHRMHTRILFCSCASAFPFFFSVLLVPFVYC